MKYEITFNSALQKFAVYQITDYSYTMVKTFKTQKSAEKWVRKHS